MKTNWTPATLQAFEREVADSFNRGEIHAPIHLAGGNEQELIDIFEDIQPQDWVCGTWRSHYHCLLKGVPPEQVRTAIARGRSIAMCFHVYRVICSALVGGILPVALGLAWAAKRMGHREQVWCFIGDMAAATGLAHECMWYATGHDLPLNLVIEDNGLSVATNTAAVWGLDRPDKATGWANRVYRYPYTLTWPHVGTGTWVAM